MLVAYNWPKYIVDWMLGWKTFTLITLMLILRELKLSKWQFAPASCTNCHKLVLMPTWHWRIKHSLSLKRLAITMVIVLALITLGCKFSTSADPCPTPPEQHQNVWAPLKTTDGVLIGWVCTGKGITNANH